MPTNLTETSTFDATITVPADGDARTAASVVTPFQSLANRSKYLKTLTETTGVQKIRSVADNAALKALTGMASGDVVKQDDIRVIYVYDSGSATPEHNGIIVEPTTGGGRWFADFSAITVEDANGDARLTLNPRNAVVAQDYQETSSGTTLNFTVADLPFGPTITMALKAGDVVMLDAFTNFFSAAVTAGRHAVAIQETHSSVTTVLANSLRLSSGEVTPNDAPMHPMTRYTVPANATYEFRMVAIIISGSSTAPTVYSPWQLRAMAIRP